MAGPGKPGPPSRSDQPAYEQLKVTAIQLRSEGLSYGEIADQLGLADRRSAQRIITRVYRENMAEDLDPHRLMELARIQRAMDEFEPIALDDAAHIDTKVKAVGTLDQFMGKKFDLLGLPIKLGELAGEDEDEDVESGQPDALDELMEAVTEWPGLAAGLIASGIGAGLSDADQIAPLLES